VQDMLGKGKSIRGCIEGDSDPQIFIPTLIDLHAQGLLPLDQIVTRYSFAQINEAVTDAAIGRTVKPVLVF
jgi:aryl-alcohol dehydrogenase